MTLEETVDILVQKKDIEDLLTWRYARAFDWLDLDAAKACFHPDGRFQYDNVDLNAHEFCEAYVASSATMTMRFHFVGCAAVSLDGDRASAETYAVFAGTRPDPATDKLGDYITGARYLAELERRDGQWRLTVLRCVFDWSMQQPTPSVTASGNPFDRGLDMSSPFFRKL